MSATRAKLILPAAVFAAATSVLASPPALARSTEEILNYHAPDRQQMLEAGARRERTVVIYSGMIVNQLLRPLTEAFHRKYPFIDIKYWRGDGNQIAAKVLAEMQAGAPMADVVEGSGLPSAAGGPQAVLAFSSPLFEALPKEDIEIGRAHV